MADWFLETGLYLLGAVLIAAIGMALACWGLWGDRNKGLGDMSWTRRAVISLVYGFGLSCVGLAMVLVAGYGPCGPGSTVSAIGAFLGVSHIVTWCTVFPFLEDWIPNGVAAVLVIPAVDWAVVAFVLLTVGGWVWRRFRPRRPDLACPACGYDLRGSAGRPECPECGESIGAVGEAGGPS